MTKYTVTIHRAMRICFAGIEAETPKAAVAIAHGLTTDQADNIEECNGDDLCTLVDVAGDETDGRSVIIDFMPGRLLKAASELLAASEDLKRQLIGAGITAESGDDPQAEIDIHPFLARRRQIAEIWSAADVQAVRPELNDQQAWAVLQAAQRYYDAAIGINWEVLGGHADRLFGPAFPTDEAEGA